MQSIRQKHTAHPCRSPPAVLQRPWRHAAAPLPLAPQQHRRLLPPPCAGPPDFDPAVGKRDRRRPVQAEEGLSLGKEQRLAKVLAFSGVASRRKCEELIAEGRVSVNGQVVSTQGFKVVPAKDAITVDGRQLSMPGAQRSVRGRAGAGGGGSRGPGTVPLHYFAVNKPEGFICSNVSSKPGRRVVDLMEGWLEAWQRRQKDKALLPPRLFTAGRLDVATTGLVLVTNDGGWANRVIHPSAGLTKEYVARVAVPPTPQQVAALRRGAEVEGVLCVPKMVEVVGGGDGGMAGDGVGGGSTKVRIVVSEGKKHEVRVLVASVGLELLKLHRTRVGGCVLPSKLRTGDYMELTPRQAEAVLRDKYESGGRQGGGRRAPGREARGSF